MLPKHEREKRNLRVVEMAASGTPRQEISNLTGIPIRTISYILDPDQARQDGRRVSEWRRNAKEALVLEAGSQCKDCGETYPPFMMDFDHRDPAEKNFAISKGPNGSIVSLERMRAEAQKCDLVCANCHRMRTHRQRCSGCKYCDGQ